MLPASTNGGGSCDGAADVCRTPVDEEHDTLVAYTNRARGRQTVGRTCSSRVRIVAKKTVTTRSTIAMSTGDEAGDGGGVVSGTTRGPARFKLGSAKVRVEGARIGFLSSTVAMNGVSNANVPTGVQAHASQRKVWVMP